MKPLENALVKAMESLVAINANLLATNTSLVDYLKSLKAKEEQERSNKMGFIASMVSMLMEKLEKIFLTREEEARVLETKALETLSKHPTKPEEKPPT